MAAADALSRERAVSLDAGDPLAWTRERFAWDSGEVVYLDGNSLGRPPRAALEAVDELGRRWQERLVRGWDDWIEWPRSVGDLLGSVVLGAGEGQVVVCDSVTVNLFKLATAALQGRPGAILCSPDEFPTDRYVLAGLGRELRELRAGSFETPTADEVARACAVRDVALVCLSHVAYRSGGRADAAGITAAAQAAGATMLWDLSHSAGSVEVALDAWGADLAVGCTYKYLCGGPGAPAFLYVRRDAQERLRSPIQGWFGQHEQFAMGSAYEPAAGVERFLAGTPPVFGLASVEAAVRLIEEAGMAALATRSTRLSDYAIELADAWLAPVGLELATPRAAPERGAHLALRHPDAWRLCRALIERARVIPDYRTPDVVRIGLAPLTSRFSDVWDGLSALRELVATGAYREVDAAPRRVT